MLIELADTPVYYYRKIEINRAHADQLVQK